jgi:hypothetical protein
MNSEYENLDYVWSNAVPINSRDKTPAKILACSGQRSHEHFFSTINQPRPGVLHHTQELIPSPQQPGGVAVT